MDPFDHDVGLEEQAIVQHRSVVADPMLARRCAGQHAPEPLDERPLTAAGTQLESVERRVLTRSSSHTTPATPGACATAPRMAVRSASVC